MEYKVVGIKGNIIKIMITKQTFICDKFCNLPFWPRKKVFISSNGLTFKSDTFPCYSKKENIIYVRGKDKHKNDYVIDLPLFLYKKFQESVREYNNTFKESTK